jgi:hypothetical protein
MQIRAGYEIIYNCPQDTPMILMVHIHYSRASDIVVPDQLVTSPAVPITAYRDMYGNWCTRIVAPAGLTRLSTDAILRDTGDPDPVFPNARQHELKDLPGETLVYLMGSRYCETDLLSNVAWNLFAATPP